MDTSNRKHRTAVVIGRMQIYHLGHATLVRSALGTADQVVIVLGSAFGSRSARNPFTWEERANMIRATLTPEELQRVSFLPVRDYFDHPRWNAAVKAGITSVSDVRDVVLVGYNKDYTTYYLRHFPQWHLHLVDKEIDVDATALRKVFFEGASVDAAMQVLQPFVHAKALDYLRTWSLMPAYQRMVREAKAITRSLETYGPGPHLAADPLVRVGDHVLLVRRGGDVGNGKWALPGGFVELHEHTRAAAIRELKEETHFPLMESDLLNAEAGNHFFQDPNRSSRGRVLTEVFYFRFGDMALPEVKGSDDAKEARWFHISELAALEDQLHDDHAVILEHFLGGVLRD